MASRFFCRGKKKNVCTVSFLYLSGQMFVVKTHPSRCKIKVLQLSYFLQQTFSLYFGIPLPLILSPLANPPHPSGAMRVSFVHTPTGSSVYSINNIMKIALREGNAQDCGDSERGVGTVYERGVKRWDEVTRNK